MACGHLTVLVNQLETGCGSYGKTAADRGKALSGAGVEDIFLARRRGAGRGNEGKRISFKPILNVPENGCNRQQHHHQHKTADHTNTIPPGKPFLRRILLPETNILFLRR